MSISNQPSPDFSNFRIQEINVYGRLKLPGSNEVVKKDHRFSPIHDAATPADRINPGQYTPDIRGRQGELDAMRELRNVTPKVSVERPALGKAADGTSPAFTGILSSAQRWAEGRSSNAGKAFCLGILSVLASIVDFVKPKRDVVTHQGLHFALSSHGFYANKLKGIVKNLNNGIEGNIKKIDDKKKQDAVSRSAHLNNPSGPYLHSFRVDLTTPAIGIMRDRAALDQIRNNIDSIEKDAINSLEKGRDQAEPPLSSEERRQVDAQIDHIKQEFQGIRSAFKETPQVNEKEIFDMAYRKKARIP